MKSNVYGGMRLKLPLLTALLLAPVALWGQAAAVSATAASATTPQTELATLFSAIRANPNDLETNFAYGQLAFKLGRYDEAMAAYERMLIINPNLPRVKLELALVQMALDNDAAAETLFNEVLDNNPPPQVQENVQTLLAQLRERQQKHQLGGAVLAGINFDSNANAAASTGEVDLLGVSIPLDSTSQKASDEHRFATLSLRHTYRLPLRGRQEWVTTGLLYKTDQSSLGNLDTTVKSIGTGPVFRRPQWRTEAGLKFTYTDINVARADYQKTSRYSGHVQYQLHPRVQVHLALGHEIRRYQNTPSTSTNELRNGQASDALLTTHFALSRKDRLSLSLRQAQINTQVDYYDNQQTSISANYQRQLPRDFLLGLTASHKVSGYDGADGLVNPNVTRKDHERSYGISLMRPLAFGVVGSVGYTWRDVDSNIQNYAYTNERWNVTLTRGF